MNQAHNPAYYIGGCYISQNQVWLGDFAATAGELYEYLSHDVNTVEEYEVVLHMITAQQVYMLWWDRMTDNKEL